MGAGLWYKDDSPVSGPIKEPLFSVNGGFCVFTQSNSSYVEFRCYASNALLSGTGTEKLIAASAFFK